MVYCGWNYSQYLTKKAQEVVSILGLDLTSFFFLCNSHEELSSLKCAGFPCDLVNQNAWLDENLVMRTMNVPKIYSAIYVGRRSAFKRHMLAEEVSDLAIVAGYNHGKDIAPIPATKYLNSQPLAPDEICEKNNQSYCGLILSEEEGACFASSEYLLCGIPVVSTHSKGGRDIWYDEYNSIVCDPTPKDIADAVAYFKTHPRDPELIRANHIEEARKHRLRFIEAFERMLHNHNVRGIDAHRYFYENFFHKMRMSLKPDFESIFPPLSRAA
jgi:glycosyltransferase involved in cell wall biosynthesis